MFLKNKNIIFKIRRLKVADYAALKINLLILLKEPSREKALLTLHVMTEMHFLLQKNLKNIMHGRVKT